MLDKPKKEKANKKDSQLLIRISTEEREQFLQLCEQLDTAAAREIRLFIRGFIKQHLPESGQKDKETVNVQEKRKRKKPKINQAKDQGT